MEQRKNWYSPAAEAYNKVRPRYPQDLIHQVVEVAQLSTDSKILEVGCSPGTATVVIAPLGCSTICLEPNPDFFRLAKQNTQEEILRGLGKMAIDSGQFKDLVSGQVVCEVTYTVDEYLMLLNTYSPCN